MFGLDLDITRVIIFFVIVILGAIVATYSVPILKGICKHYSIEGECDCGRKIGHMRRAQFIASLGIIILTIAISINNGKDIAQILINVAIGLGSILVVIGFSKFLSYVDD